MADDQDFEMWDDEFLEKAIQLTEAAVCSSVSNPTQHQPPQPQQLFRPPLPPLPLSAPPISYSPPRELSQRVKEDEFVPKGFDWQFNGYNRDFSSAPLPPVNSNGAAHCVNSATPLVNSKSVAPPGNSVGTLVNSVVPSVSNNNVYRLLDGEKCAKEKEVERVKVNNSCGLRDEENCVKEMEIDRLKVNNLSRDEDSAEQKEIDRLKEELGRVSNMLTNLEQECLELKKDREKNEKHLRMVVPVNGTREVDAICAKKSNLKNKDPVEDHSFISPGAKGVVSCKAVGVQTDEHVLVSDMTIKENLSVSRKLAGIWEPRSDQQPRTNLVSKLFVACEADLQVLFGCLGLSIPFTKATTKMAPNHCIQPVEAAKVSHLYLTLTKISYDTGRLDDLLEALADLCCLQNTLIVHRSLCVLHVVLKHILSIENNICSRDNVIVNDPSTVNKSSGIHSEMGQHPLLARLTSANKIWNNDSLRDESPPLISCSKWLSLYQMMHQIITKHSEETLRVEAVSIMNILLLRTDAYKEREMYGEVTVFQSISQLLRKEAGVGVQKQTVHLLYLLLNCPNLMSMFCSFSKEEGTTAEVPTTNPETAPAFPGPGAILDGLADCLACRGNGAPTTLVLKLQRNSINLLAFLASSGRRGFELLLGRNLSRRANFLYLILQVLASEIDVEASECVQPSDDFRERTFLIREVLILLNRLASSSQYSTQVLRVLTNRRDMAILTIDIASRLSRKDKWLRQSDTMTRQMRESEIVDLARIFKKRVFNFLGDATSEK